MPFLFPSPWKRNGLTYTSELISDLVVQRKLDCGNEMEDILLRGDIRGLHYMLDTNSLFSILFYDIRLACKFSKGCLWKHPKIMIEWCKQSEVTFDWVSWMVAVGVKMDEIALGRVVLSLHELQPKKTLLGMTLEWTLISNMVNGVARHSYDSKETAKQRPWFLGCGTYLSWSKYVPCKTNGQKLPDLRSNGVDSRYGLIFCEVGPVEMWLS